jgi:hypothetical protein
MELSDNPPAGWFELFKRKRVKCHKALIEEIQKRAPRAAVSISWLVRHQWKRL